MRRLLVLSIILLLAACGFHLRGQAGMPFATLYLQTSLPNSPLAIELRRNLEANKVKLVDSADKADVVLNIVSDRDDKQILTLGGSGRVTEFELYYRVSLRAYDLKGMDWIPAEDMAIRRDYTYSDTQVLAKEQEEAMLYQSMHADMVQQIIRRLSHAKPQPQ
jgi:LPS-assembly lipoprotein